MGREVRRVPMDWQHPTGSHGDYIGLMGDYERSIAEFEADVAKDGLRQALDDWSGGPCSSDYMPTWTEEEAVGWQMYENVSEGTPISPVMASPEELARWLADNGGNAFAFQTATYDQWLAMIRRGYAPSAIAVSGVLMSGVEAAS